MTKEENPQTQERDFPLSWKAQTPLSYIPTARLLLLFSLQHPIKATTTVCATCYFTDLPTDSSEEAIYSLPFKKGEKVYGPTIVLERLDGRFTMSRGSVWMAGFLS